VESKAVNYLVNQYLVEAGHRLTAITFADEVANQDLDDWEEVGLNVPNPPSLAAIFRAYIAQPTPAPARPPAPACLRPACSVLHCTALHAMRPRPASMVP
jgi:hypothetical protein